MNLSRIKADIIQNGWQWPPYQGSWLAATTTPMSGIFKFNEGRAVYFHIIPPWHMCPDGRIDLEEV